MNPKVDIQAKAKEVAEYLEGWQYKPPKDSSDRWVTEITAHLSGPDGAEIFLNVSWREKQGRMVIGGHYPMNYHSSKSLSITVDAQRDSFDIAKEIRRRFLPAYLKCYQEALAHKRKHEEYVARSEALAKELAESLGVTSNGASLRIYRDPIHGRIEVAGDGVTVELRGLNAAQAKAICRILEKRGENNEKL